MQEGDPERGQTPEIKGNHDHSGKLKIEHQIEREGKQEVEGECPLPEIVFE